MALRLKLSKAWPAHRARTNRLLYTWPKRAAGQWLNVVLFDYTCALQQVIFWQDKKVLSGEMPSKALRKYLNFSYSYVDILECFTIFSNKAKLTQQF